MMIRRLRHEPWSAFSVGFVNVRHHSHQRPNSQEFCFLLERLPADVQVRAFRKNAL